MERKKLKQQKMSFVNSIFNSSVSKLVKWQSWHQKADKEKKESFFEKVESLSFSKKGSIPKRL